MNKNVKEIKFKAIELCKDGIGGFYVHVYEELFPELLIKECSNIAAMFSINKNSIHPDISYDEMSESTKMIVHTTCQQISNKIKEHFGIE